MIPKPLKLKPGDTIFYPSAGVGVIESVEDVYLSGRLEKCYVIRIPETQMTVKVPKTNVQKSGIRSSSTGPNVARRSSGASIPAPASSSAKWCAI